MGAFDMELKLDSVAFMGMRNDADIILQRLAKNMVEKKSMEGSVTIKLDIKLELDTLPVFDQDGEQTGAREILRPRIDHKIGSVMKIEGKANGENSFEDMELVWDAEKQEFVFRPVSNTAQTTIFDDQYQGIMNPPLIEGEVIAEAEELPLIDY